MCVFGHFWVFQTLLTTTTAQEFIIGIEIRSYAGFNGLKMDKNQCFYNDPLVPKNSFFGFFRYVYGPLHHLSNPCANNWNVLCSEPTQKYIFTEYVPMAFLRGYFQSGEIR